jgi:hypothetical protein
MTHMGLGLVYKRYFAFLDAKQETWDMANAHNDAALSEHFDPWNGTGEDHKIRGDISNFWSTIEETERAWFEVIAFIKFDDIIEIDEMGDDMTKNPHIFVNWKPRAEAPFHRYIRKVESISRWSPRSINPDLKKRTRRFPDDMRIEIKDADAE